MGDRGSKAENGMGRPDGTPPDVEAPADTSLGTETKSDPSGKQTANSRRTCRCQRGVSGALQGTLITRTHTEMTGCQKLL